MTAVVIREKLHQIINRASDSKVKAMYTLMKDNEESVDDKWNDKAFVNEMQSRVDDVLSGKDKGYSVEQVISMARKKLAKSKK
jgi:hypothetical protein